MRTEFFLEDFYFDYWSLMTSACTETLEPLRKIGNDREQILNVGFPTGSPSKGDPFSEPAILGNVTSPVLVH